MQFHFDNVAESNGLAPICVIRLQATAIRETAQATIGNAPTVLDYDYDAAC